ncbi:MAG: hypothetical protein H7Y39_14600 [Nitrospiraceae bacterium]|nr:hypothetical protein [Nitrospiraceae bacterium]
MTMKRISFHDSDCSRFIFHKQRGIVVLIVFALAGLLACERTPDQTQEAKKPAVADRPGVLHITSAELARTVMRAVEDHSVPILKEVTSKFGGDYYDLRLVDGRIGGNSTGCHEEIHPLALCEHKT